MIKDTIIYFNDSISPLLLKDSTLIINHKIELFNTVQTEKLLFGLPTEFVTIAFSTIITIIIFSLGLFLQWRNKKKDRLLELSSYKTVLIEWTKLTERTISIQYQLFQTFRNKLLTQENISPISFVNESFLIDKLQELNLRQLMDIIVINKEGDKKENTLILLNIVSNIHKLSKIEQSIKDKYNEFLDYTLLLQKKWNSNVKSLDNYIESLPLKLANSKNKDASEFYKSITRVYDEFNSSSNNKTTSKTRVKELYKPLESICTQFIEKDIAFAEPYSILPTLKELSFIEYRWSKYKKGVIEFFAENENITKVSYSILNSNIQILENMKFKRWNKIQ